MANPSFSLLQGDPSTWGLPAVGKTYVGINASGQLVTKQNAGTIAIITTGIPGIQSVTNTSGTTTVTPTSPVYSELVNVQGAARAVLIVLSTAGVLEGFQVQMLITLPDLPNFLLTFRNADGSGTVLGTFDNTGSPNIVSLNVVFKFISGAWILWNLAAPAY